MIIIDYPSEAPRKPDPQLAGLYAHLREWTKGQNIRIVLPSKRHEQNRPT